MLEYLAGFAAKEKHYISILLINNPNVSMNPYLNETEQEMCQSG